jgi:hypothetical protein
MSRHQLTHQESRDTDDKGQPAAAQHSLPATEMVRAMLARGQADPHAIADIMVAHPGARMEIFLLLHKTMGNAFANEVSRHAVAAGGLGEARDVTTFDRPGEYMESRATIDGPPKSEAPSTFGEYQESRATIDHPHADIEKPAYDDGGYMEARATIDHPHTEKAESPWVERARRFNRAHPDNVRAFLDSTGTSCVDEAGEPDPKKVARWQADHGLSPDGRIGDQTVRAAVSDPSLAL